MTDLVTRTSLLAAIAVAALSLSCSGRNQPTGMRVTFVAPKPGDTVAAVVAVAVDVVGGTDPITVAFAGHGGPAVVITAAPFLAQLALSAEIGATATLTALAVDARGKHASTSVEVKVDRRLPPPDGAAAVDAPGAPGGDGGRLDVAAPGSNDDTRAAADATLPVDGAVAPADAPIARDTGGASDTRPDAALGPDALAAAKLTKLTLTPASCVRVVAGQALQLRAWGDFADGGHREITTAVAWSSMTPDKATVGAQTGKVAGVAAGMAKIAATSEGMTAMVEVAVVDWHVSTAEPDALLEDFRAEETGKAVAVWRVPETGGRIGISFRIYDPATDSWGALTPIDTGTVGTVEDALIGLNQNNDLLAIWVLHHEGTNTYELWHTSRWFGQWTSGRLSRAGADARSLGLVMDRFGTGFAHYSDLTLNGTVREVWSVRFTARDGWGQPIAIGSPGNFGRLAFDRTGNSRALWRGTAGMFTRQFDRMAATWGVADLLPGSGDANFSVLGGERFGMDADGNAVTAWLSRQTGGTDNVMTSRLTRGGSWSAPMALNAPAGRTGDFPEAAAGIGGHMLVAWQQYLQGAEWRLMARAFDPMRGWQEAADDVGAIPGSGPHNDARIAINPDGTTALAWLAAGNIKLRTFHPGHGWGDTIDVPQSSGGVRPRVLLDASCNTHVLWERLGAQVYDTFSARLRPN